MTKPHYSKIDILEAAVTDGGRDALMELSKDLQHSQLHSNYFLAGVPERATDFVHSYWDKRFASTVKIDGEKKFAPPIISDFQQLSGQRIEPSPIHMFSRLPTQLAAGAVVAYDLAMLAVGATEYPNFDPLDAEMVAAKSMLGAAGIAGYELMRASIFGVGHMVMGTKRKMLQNAHRLDILDRILHDY